MKTFAIPFAFLGFVTLSITVSVFIALGWRKAWFDLDAAYDVI